MNKTPFEAGKTAKELGIDTSRKFVVVKKGNFDVGDVLVLSQDDNSYLPWFTRLSDNKKTFTGLDRLAYAEEPEPYKPMVGDKVSLEGEIVKKYTEGILHVEINGTLVVVMTEKEYSQMKLLFRKTRTLTKPEAEAILTEKLGERIIIE